MQFQHPIPVLRIFSEEKAREFYLGFLGMRIDWEHRFEADAPLYAQVSRGSLVLHLSEHFGDATPGSTAYIPLSGIAELQAELLAKQYRHARPHLQQQDWGTTMDIADPFGNRLRFCQPA